MSPVCSVNDLPGSYRMKRCMRGADAAAAPSDRAISQVRPYRCSVRVARARAMQR